MNSRRTASVLLALSLLAACGGGGGDEEAETTTTAAGATTTAAGSPDTGFEIPEVEFEDADFRVRFVNVFSDGGADSEVDFSWGNYSARSDAASLGYGEASEMLEGKVPSQTLTDDPEEGKVDMGVVAQRSGAAEDDQPIMSDDEIVAEGQELIWILGSDEDPMNAGATSGTSRWIFVDGGDDDVPEPAAGKANLFLIETGLGHLEDDFVTMGAPGACLSFQNDSGGGNAGPVFEVDPGSMQIGIYDANGGCSEPTGTLVDLEVKAGHRYLVVAYGHTKQTRTALIIDLDE
ncbi:MAG: hypothetical protein IPG97_09320 [Microthrixaceae bacterium]|jgi:hypothetical protein|nr:hypothetical protein [Microthrixaceae bacterium]